MMLGRAPRLSIKHMEKNASILNVRVIFTSCFVLWKVTSFGTTVYYHAKTPDVKLLLQFDKEI